MTVDQMWFGNTNHAQWVPHPVTGMTRAHDGYSEVLQFDNGGRYVKRTAASSIGYEMNFPVGDSSQYTGLEVFERYAAGEYGSDYLRFIDPMWADQNIMPEPWAAPGLAEQGWKPIYDDPTPTFTNTGVNTFTKPMRAVSFDIVTPPNTKPTGQNSVMTFLVPPTNTLWVGGCGSVSGTAVLRAEAFYIIPRVNLILNPDFEVDVTQWTANAGGALTRSTSQFFSGLASALLTLNTTTATATSFFTTITTVVGQSYTVSAYVRNSVGTRSVKLTAQATDSSTVALSGSWQRISATFVASGTTATVTLSATTTGAVSDAFYVDAVLAENATTLGTYFDGDTYGSVWTGTAGASTSIASSTTMDTALSADSAAPALTSSFDGSIYNVVQIYVTSTDATVSAITLTATWAQCLVTGVSPVIARHLPGRGHMGLIWDGSPRVETYQLGTRHLTGASMVLVEVEPWD